MFYYKPYPDVAYDSIKDIHFVVPTGRFIRNIHRWAANVMVVAVLLHMARVFYTAAYRKPREFNWLIGMGLLVVTLGLSFTGYLLPWDQLAYWAITIGANIAQSPREVTDALGITQYFDSAACSGMLLGSDVVGEEALIRFYLLHVMILPLVLAVLIGVHFWRIRKDGGLARPADADQRLGPPPTGDLSRVHRGAAEDLSPGRHRARPHAAGRRGPENTVPSMPHLFYAEAGVFMLTVLDLRGAGAGLRRAAEGTGQSRRARRTRPRRRGTSSACRNWSRSRRSWAASAFRRSSSSAWG